MVVCGTLVWDWQNKLGSSRIYVNPVYFGEKERKDGEGRNRTCSEKGFFKRFILSFLDPCNWQTENL